MFNTAVTAMVCGAVSGVQAQQQHASSGLQMGHGAVAGDGGESKESGVRLSEGLGGGRPRWRRGQVVGAMERVRSKRRGSPSGSFYFMICLPLLGAQGPSWTRHIPYICLVWLLQSLNFNYFVGIFTVGADAQFYGCRTLAKIS